MRYQSALERHEIVKNMPDPPQYVEGLIVDGFTVMAAKSGFGKTWFAYDAATSIATGDYFLGRKTTKADVLYLDFEASDKLSDNRLMKQLNGRPIPKNLYIEKNPMEWTFDNGNFEQQMNYIKNETNIKVIFCDILQPIKPKMGRKETEYDVAYKFGTKLHQIINGTGIGFVAMMHCNKGAYNEEDPFNTILGSVGWQGASDTAIVWQKKRRTDKRALLSATGRIDKEINAYMDWNDDTLRWEWVGAKSQLKGYEELAAYERKPITRIIKSLLGKETTWRGTAQDAAAALTHMNLSSDSIGRYLNSPQCQEVKNRDGINVLKHRYNGKTEYIITRDLQEAMADPDLVSDIFEKIA